MLRDFLEGLKDRFHWRGHADGAAGPLPGRRLPWKPVLGVAVAVLVLYYPVGMMLAHRINGEVDYQTPAEFAHRAAALRSPTAPCAPRLGPVLALLVPESPRGATL